MARFRATIQGQRGAASRLGSTSSGIQAYINGWDIGINVDGMAGPDNDIFNVYLTGGSNGGSGSLFIGRAYLRDGQPCFKFDIAGDIIEQLVESLAAITDHAKEQYPHFESQRGQVDIAAAERALAEARSYLLGVTHE